MARKRAPKVPVSKTAAKDVKPEVPMRFMMPEADYRRVERQARERGLSKSAYARMCILFQLTDDEQEGCA